MHTDSPQLLAEGEGWFFFPQLLQLSTAFAAQQAPLGSPLGLYSLPGNPTESSPAKKGKWGSDALWEIWFVCLSPLVPGETQDKQARC